MSVSDLDPSEEENEEELESHSAVIDVDFDVTHMPATGSDVSDEEEEGKLCSVACV